MESGQAALPFGDEADQLRGLPSAVGIPGLVGFILLFVFIRDSADLGFWATLGASLFVAAPGLILIGKDLKLARRLRLLERRIAEVHEEALEGPNDDRRLRD